MTPDEFEEALAAAIQGEIRTDTGANTELEEAFIAIASRESDADLATREAEARRIWRAMPDDGTSIRP